MSIGTANFHPSAIEDNIYNLIDCEDYIVSSCEYTEKCMEAVGSYLQSEGVQWSSIWSNYQDETGYSVSFAWIEAGRLHHIVLDCRKEGCY